MKSLSERIKIVRKKLGVNQIELGEILGCTDGKIKYWEQGQTDKIKARDALILQNKFGFNQDWLMEGKGEMMLETGELLLKDIKAVKNMLDDNLDIPFYKDINASAGYGCSNGECLSTNITISKDMIPTVSKNIEAIRVSGNSMYPTINDEDIIFINKDSQEPQNGKIYVVFLCDECYVKRIFIDPKTKDITLNSDNPIFPVLKVDCEDFRIIGQVVANMKISKL